MKRIVRFIQDQWCIHRRKARIRSFIHNGQKPWTTGYGEYRERVIGENLNNLGLIGCFRSNRTLPVNYGYRLDERVIELPWAFSRLSNGEDWLLDAGSALNFPYLMDHEVLGRKRIVIYTLSAEDVVKQSNISYVYGDLRNTLFRDECFDEIVCISTLEHVGMDNTFLYSRDVRFDENQPRDYLKVSRGISACVKTGRETVADGPLWSSCRSRLAASLR